MIAFIITGPPYSGKGTHVSLLLKKYGDFTHLSTGIAIREEKNNNTSLFHELKKFLHSGELVPDPLIYKIINKYLGSIDNSKKVLLIDGFPRNVDQAKHYCNFESKNNITTLGVIVLSCKDQDKLIDRAKSRFLIEGREDDSDEKVIMNRLDVYRIGTYPMLQILEKKGYDLIEIDSDRDIIDVYMEIEGFIRSKCAEHRLQRPCS